MRKAEAWAVSPLILMFGLALALWPIVPGEVPTRWADGSPTGLAARGPALLTLPSLALGCYLTFWITLRRHGDDGLFAAVRGGLNVTFTILYLDHVTSFWGYGPHPAAAMGAILAIAGLTLPLFSRNGLIGIRTRWAMRSERSWVRSNRLGGRVFTGLGVVLLVLGLLDVPAAMLLGWLLIVATCVGLAVYSYVEWRNDPDADRIAG